jgi:leader peptidase (prepilin peptidase)/N-methyltransferase
MNMEIFLFALLGLLLGVLINRIADNLPRERSILSTPLCPYCGIPRPALDQIATLSYLVFRGRCPNCRAPIPLRAPFVEIAHALLFAFLWTRDGMTLQLALHLIYTFVFGLVFVIDLEHRLIFNIIMFPAIIFAILASPFSKIGWKLALAGGVVAFVIVFAIYYGAILFSRARKLNIPGGAFGQGDITLATFMGLVVGLQNVFPAIVLTILLGGAGAIGFIAYQFIRYRRVALGTAIPYGPFFCIAGWWMMVLGM